MDSVQFAPMQGASQRTFYAGPYSTPVFLAVGESVTHPLGASDVGGGVMTEFLAAPPSDPLGHGAASAGDIQFFQMLDEVAAVAGPVNGTTGASLDAAIKVMEKFNPSVLPAGNRQIYGEMLGHLKFLKSFAGPIGVGFDVVHIAAAEDKARAVGEVAGSGLGAWGGAAVGFWVCGGPADPMSPLCAGVGALLGGFGGGEAGGALVDAMRDADPGGGSSGGPMSYDDFRYAWHPRPAI